MPDILLVEDDRQNYDMLRRRLERKGHDVRLATDGEEAVEEAEGQIPDLILMDIRLPGKNGYEATRTIRQFEGGRGTDVPIIALTAHAFAEGETQARAAGCDDYHVKPVHFTKLLEQMEALLKTS